MSKLVGAVLRTTAGGLTAWGLTAW